MAVRTKTASQAAEKWRRRASVATPDYQAGVQSPRADWATSTTAAEATYKQAVTTAANAGRFGKGVSKAGSGKWQRGAIEKGAARWAPGIDAGEADYGKGIADVLNTVAAVALPPRGVKGDPRNLDRVRLIADALHKKATQ